MGEGIKTRRGESQGVEIDYLYNEGQDFALGGGIVTHATSGGGAITYNATNISLSTTEFGAVRTIGSDIPIDFTPYTKLKMVATATSTCYGGVAVGKSLSDFIDNYVARVPAPITSNPAEFEVDISSVNGSYYFAFRTGGVSSAVLYKAWLE